MKALGAIGAVGTAGLAGCLDDGGSSDSDGKKSLEVIHGWVGGDGAAAIKALESAFAEEHSDVSKKFEGIGASANVSLNTTVTNRLKANDPMSSFSNWPGNNLERYKGSLMSVEKSVWDEGGLKEKIHKATVEQHRFNGKMPGVPIGSHRMNNLFYNVHVFKKAGVDATSLDSVEKLISAFETIKQKTDATPMAQAMKAPWTNLQLFAQILTSQSGVSAYTDFIEGNPDGKAIRSALKAEMKILKNHINSDASSVNFTTANQKVIKGDAGSIHQGNWVYGMYRGDSKFKYKKDWNWVPFPGTEGIYFFHLDSFIAPEDNPSPELTKQWLKFVGSKKAQITFNNKKGSVPVRTDIDSSKLTPFLQRTYKDLQSAKKLPPTIAHGLAVTPKTLGKCKDAFGQNFMDPYDVEATAKELEAAVSN